MVSLMNTEVNNLVYQSRTGWGAVVASEYAKVAKRASSSSSSSSRSCGEMDFGVCNWPFHTHFWGALLQWLLSNVPLTDARRRVN